MRLEPVELVVERREARDQDTLPRPGRFPDSQGGEAGKPSHEQVILHEPAVEHILGQRTVADGVQELRACTQIPEFACAQGKTRFRKLFHLRPSSGWTKGADPASSGQRGQSRAPCLPIVSSEGMFLITRIILD